MEPAKPLSPAEIDEIDKFLTSDDVPESSMNVSALHGFLTAFPVGPALVLPSEWLREVWGEEGPIFDTEEQAQPEVFIRAVQESSWQPTSGAGAPSGAASKALNSFQST